MGLFTLSCAHAPATKSGSDLASLAKACIDAHIQAGWLSPTFFRRERVVFRFSTHPELPFWGVHFRDYALLSVDGREPSYGCSSGKDSLRPARIWFAEGGPPYEVRKLAEVGWDPESYSEDEWEEFSLGKEAVYIEGMSLEDLGLQDVWSPAGPVD
jgi:hypothetical protein